MAKNNGTNEVQLVAVSGCFTLIYLKNVTFYLWHPGNGALLSICITSLQNCLLSYAEETEGWERRDFQLKPEMFPEKQLGNVIICALKH